MILCWRTVQVPQPVTRYDVVGGYLHLDGLSAVAEHLREERP